MEPAMSVLVDGVLAASRSAGLSDASLKYHRSCCATVVRYCVEHGIKEYDEHARAMFLAKLAGNVQWQRRRPKPTPLPSSFGNALFLFEESLSGTLAVGSVELVVGETRRLLTHLRDHGHMSFSGVGPDEMREFLMAVAPKHQSGIGNTVWAVKRFFAFLNDPGCAACGWTRCCRRSRRDGCGSCRASRRTRLAGCSP